MRSIHDVPVEILRVILEKTVEDNYWYDDRQDQLKLIRLVCKVWSEEGGALMWAEIQILGVGQLDKLVELGVLECYTTRSLSLHQTYQMKPEVRERILSTFEKLEHLRLSTGTWDTSLFKRSNLKNLKSLLFDQITMKDDPPISRSDVVFSLKELHLQSYDSPSSIPLSVFYKPSLTSFSFHVPDYDEGFKEDLLQFLLLCAPHLHSLTLAKYDPMTLTNDFLPIFTSFTSLQSLSIAPNDYVSLVCLFPAIPCQLHHLEWPLRPVKGFLTALKIVLDTADCLQKLGSIRFPYASEEDVLGAPEGMVLLDMLETRDVKTWFRV